MSQPAAHPYVDECRRSVDLLEKTCQRFGLDRTVAFDGAKDLFQTTDMTFAQAHREYALRIIASEMEWYVRLLNTLHDLFPQERYCSSVLLRGAEAGLISREELQRANKARIDNGWLEFTIHR